MFRKAAILFLFTTSPALAQVTGDMLPHDLSPWGMFLGADYVVKAVMIGLAFASVVTWTIALFKAIELITSITVARRSHRLVAESGSLPAAAGLVAQRRDAVARMLRATGREVEAARPFLAAAGDAGTKERIASALSRIEARDAARLASGTGMLATIGATAPFVGLFGTVWGIMDAFVGISQSQTTNLAVVAPGIAEALLATAMGLVAAIPAVVIYNFCGRAIGAHRLTLREAAALIARMASRTLDSHAGEVSDDRRNAA